MLMENPALLLSISTFVIIVLLFWAVASLLSVRGKEQDVLKRAAKWSKLSTSTDASYLDEQATKKERKFGIPNFLRKADKDVKTSFYADTPLFYQRAGIYERGSIRYYQVLRIFFLFIPITALFISYYLYNLVPTQIILLITFISACLAYFLPVLYLKIIAHYRKKDLNRYFPDAMDLLMVCVEAGIGIDAAIRRVSREIFVSSPALAQEFKILSLELKAGKSRSECLKNLAIRTNLADVNNLVSLLIQAERYGTGIANALRIHAEEMREKRYSTLEELAAKLPVKLVIPLVLCIFPALFVVIIGPAIITIYHNLIER